MASTLMNTLISSSHLEESYAGVKSLIHHAQNDTAQMIDFFKERARLEEDYAKGLERLSKKGEGDVAAGSPIGIHQPTPTTTQIAFRNLQLTLSSSALTHRSFVSNVDTRIIKVLQKDKEQHLKDTMDLRGRIKSSIQSYTECKNQVVHRARKAYEHKCRELETITIMSLKAEKEESSGNKRGIYEYMQRDVKKKITKMPKIQKEIEELDLTYRQSIRDLEGKRRVLQETMNATYRDFERMEMNRVLVNRDKFLEYLKGEEILAQDKTTLAQNMETFVNCIKTNVDAEQLSSEAREVGWFQKRIAATYYVNYWTGVTKDVVFGTPLRVHLEAKNRDVPLIIERCASIIERHGSDKVGIYRIGGSTTEITRLRQEFEANENANLFEVTDGPVDRASSRESLDERSESTTTPTPRKDAPAVEFTTASSSFTTSSSSEGAPMFGSTGYSPTRTPLRAGGGVMISTKSDDILLPSVSPVIPDRNAQWSDIHLSETIVHSPISAVSSNESLVGDAMVGSPQVPDAPAANKPTDDINNIANLLKLYLRELPEPLFPFPLADRVESSRLTNETDRLSIIQSRYHQLPAYNQKTIKYILDHLSRIAAEADKNRMNSENLGIIFGPCMFGMNDFSVQGLKEDSVMRFMVEKNAEMTVEASNLTTVAHSILPQPSSPSTPSGTSPRPR